MTEQDLKERESFFTSLKGDVRFKTFIFDVISSKRDSQYQVLAKSDNINTIYKAQGAVEAFNTILNMFR